MRLAQKDRTRHTFYSEVLDLITAFESGLASELEKRSEALGRKLEPWEVDSVFDKLAALPLWKPLIEKARMKMASRDLAFRDALHENISEYIRATVSRGRREEFAGFGWGAGEIPDSQDPGTFARSHLD